MFDEETSRRFWSLVDMSGGPDACWRFGRQWAFSCAAIGDKTRPWLPHRVAYILANGTLEPELKVRHLCEMTSAQNYTCVNPKHLRKGTQRENMWDRAIRDARKFAPGVLVGYEDFPDWKPRQRKPGR